VGGEGEGGRQRGEAELVGFLGGGEAEDLFGDA
jgi:hypothetical protein